eukprot:6191129-Pleurochrysis_carterae.AAC.1
MNWTKVDTTGNPQARLKIVACIGAQSSDPRKQLLASTCSDEATIPPTSLPIHRPRYLPTDLATYPPTSLPTHRPRYLPKKDPNLCSFTASSAEADIQQHKPRWNNGPEEHALSDPDAVVIEDAHDTACAQNASNVHGVIHPAHLVRELVLLPRTFAAPSRVHASTTNTSWRC